MLTPYNPNNTSYYADNNYMDIEKKPEATLKRTNSDEPNPDFFTNKKVKTEHNDEPIGEVSLRHLKQYVGVVYPKAFQDFNLGLEPVDFSTAYHFAAKEMDLELINLLLKFGAPVNGLDAQNENALMVACRVHRESCKIGGYIAQRSENIIKKLLDAKCNPFQQNINKLSPMHWISSTKSVELFTQLKDLGYDLNTPLNSLGDSPLTLVCNRFQKETPQQSFEIVNALVDLGCDLMQKGESDMPLEILARDKILNADGYLSLLNKIPEEHQPLAYNILLSTDNQKVFKELIKKGVSIHAFDNKGKSPLYRAVEKLDKDMITYLIRNGANYQQQRPVNSIHIHLSEASSPFELLQLKMKECCEIIVLQLKNQSQLSNLSQQLNKNKAIWAKFPSAFDDFLLSNGNEDSKDRDYYDLMISYLFKGYRILLQSKQNEYTSNEVMDLLNAFQILSKKILDKYEDESADEYEDEAQKLSPLDFLSHFGKFFNAIQSTLHSQHDPQKTCELISNLMKSMEEQFITGNFEEESESIDISISDELKEPGTPELECPDQLPGKDDDIPEEETGKLFTLQNELGEEVVCKYI